MTSIPAHLAELGTAHRRLLVLLDGVDDAACRAPSLLPGWSRGHVLTHIARNAEALGRLATGLITGTPGEMYPGGQDARNAAIEAGSNRSAAELVADVGVQCAKIETTFQLVPAAAWDSVVHTLFRDLDARMLPWLRRREVETHTVDLGLAIGFADLPEDFLRVEWDNARTRLAETLGGSARVGVSGEAPALDPADAAATYVADLPTMAAWVLGRATPAGWPVLNWS